MVVFCGVSRFFVTFCGSGGDGVRGVCVVVSVVVFVAAAAAVGGWGWEVRDSRMMEDTEHSQSIR